MQQRLESFTNFEQTPSHINATFQSDKSHGNAAFAIKAHLGVDEAVAIPVQAGVPLRVQKVIKVSL